MHRNYYFLHVVTLCLALISTSIIADNALPINNLIIPVIDTEGMAWHDDWQYITYLCKDSNDQLCFRTYPFTTINVPGFYTLANNVNNQITITVPNVTLDMNGCTVNGGISINGGLANITIFNGTVSNALDGILVNDDCKTINLKKITAKNCLRGISLQQVNTGIISNCDLVLNTTGLNIDTSRNIYVENCTAHANLQAGFSLLTSTTCTLVNCQAISTGDGNLNLAGNQSNVFGFVASNGYGNIFERCIANSTQALTATAPETIVAGFGLRGTEGCSKIIQCEAGNGTSGINGLTTPYGIWLETQFDGLTTATSTNPGTSAADSVLTLNWSPDGAYLAIGGGQLDAGASNGLRVYQFDRNINALIQVATVNPGGGTTADNINEVAWSPDGQFLAVGGQFTTSGGNVALIIYRFDSSNQTLTQILSRNPSGSTDDSVTCLSWSFDGRYLAVGGTLTTNDVYVYRFDKVAQTITQVDSANPDGGADDDLILAVDWSPDGQYLAVGGLIVTDPTASLFVYLFNRNGESLTQVEAVNPDDGNPGDGVFSVRWSPNGTYLAAGGVLSDTTGNDLFLYRFNRSTNQLIEVDSVNPGGGANNDTVYDIDWSADSTYLAISGNISGDTSNLLYVYKFNPATEKLTQVNTVSAGGPGDLFAVQWSPDGQYLAVGGAITGDDLIIYNALRFPLQNVITDNTIYCDSGGNGPSGVGINGSSIGNYIVGNRAYANPLNPPIIGSNYYFVCNVFNPLFGDEPTALQNIMLNSKTPIPSRYDIPAGLNRLEVLAQSLVDHLL